MPVKVSEKNALLSLLCLSTGLWLLITTTMITTPIRISEKGIALLLLATALIGLGILGFTKARVKA